MSETIQQLLRERADDDGIAIRWGAESSTWREHVAESSAVAAALLGVADRARPMHVGTLLGNTPDMLRAMAAAALGGYTLCGINDTRRGYGLLQDVRRAECQLLVTDAEHRPLLDGLDLDGVRVLDTSSQEWADLLAAAGPLAPYREVEAMDTFMMIFTSGTSGDPKAVQVNHLMVLFSGLNLQGRFELGPDDVCYVAMPLFHSNAVVAGWSPAVCAGATIVPARFSASRFLTDVRQHGVTYMNYVGKPLAYVLATPEQPDDADNTLRVAFGNEASDRDIDEFGRRFGCAVWDGFGSTELAVIITREPGTPPGSIGKGFEGVAIYDPETVTERAVAEFDGDGRLVNADAAVGELVNTTGGGYFSGYYNDPAANDERMRHGMYWSGDLAYRDAEGWIYLAGRTADWMRVDGENLAAAPIERVLQRLGAVNRVAVYAVPDESVGDQVMAAVVLRDAATLTPADLEAFLAAQPDLSAKAWPRYVRIAPDLPSTATNKVLKRELAAQGATAGNGMLWVREPRGTTYAAQESVPA
ncbi:fatty-acid--CoA ligase FadD1 [Nocardioides sp. YIM 152315]|uniref:fatty-acid--CoA ligase FadD1 n=1 Tax=Nocardioides sp. YIM 152315 TaxID=3031760 RepID=UPI0023DAD93F|nr:fatty-acid--CoA ligase FadD1 [Nocardioides sp. YIM 152315]MDF1602432.1 fatty-acid--CoA ligase FadD1 [Nocardioides sp. YIM 152315]